MIGEMKDRKMDCDHGVDPVWYTAMLRKQRQRELCADYKARQREEFRTVGLDKIEEMLIEDGGLHVFFISNSIFELSLRLLRICADLPI